MEDPCLAAKAGVSAGGRSRTGGGSPGGERWRTGQCECCRLAEGRLRECRMSAEGNPRDLSSRFVDIEPLLPPMFRCSSEF